MSNLKGKYLKLQKIVEKELSCNAHDIDHTMRVLAMSLQLAKKEKNVDLDILKTAALLHDIARVKEDDDRTGKICHAELSAIMCKPILKELGYSKNKIEKIKQCILAHRFKSENKPESIEAKILFDADKLEALGAIMIIRAGMWIARNNANIFPKMSLKRYIKMNLVDGKPNGRIKDNSQHCLYYEYELKNKKIPARLYTKTGKKIAKARLKFNTIFLDRLGKEAKGIL